MKISVGQCIWEKQEQSCSVPRNCNSWRQQAVRTVGFFDGFESTKWNGYSKGRSISLFSAFSLALSISFSPGKMSFCHIYIHIFHFMCFCWCAYFSLTCILWCCSTTVTSAVLHKDVAVLKTPELITLKNLMNWIFLGWVNTKYINYSKSKEHNFCLQLV